MKHRAFLILGLLVAGIFLVGGAELVRQSRQDLCFWDRAFPFIHRPENVSLTNRIPLFATDLDHYIELNDLAVTGTVIARYPSRWSTQTGAPPLWPGTTLGRGNTIMTEWDFQLDRVLKGDVNDGTLRIRTLGGKVCRDSLFERGLPVLEVGDKYLIFLDEVDGALEERGYRLYDLHTASRFAFVIWHDMAISQIEYGGGEVWHLEQLEEYITQRATP